MQKEAWRSTLFYNCSDILDPNALKISINIIAVIFYIYSGKFEYE